VLNVWRLLVVCEWMDGARVNVKGGRSIEVWKESAQKSSFAMLSPRSRRFSGGGLCRGSMHIGIITKRTVTSLNDTTPDHVQPKSSTNAAIRHAPRSHSVECSAHSSWDQRPGGSVELRARQVRVSRREAPRAACGAFAAVAWLALSMLHSTPLPHNHRHRTGPSFAARCRSRSTAPSR